MLSIIILTFDRSEYLNRILNYYANLQVKYPIVVSDASNKQFLKQNTKLINSLNNKINIIHDIYPSNTYHFEAFLGSLEKIDRKKRKVSNIRVSNRIIIDRIRIKHLSNFRCRQKNIGNNKCCTIFWKKFF